MNYKELDVMEKILQCKHVTAISSEKALELIDEIRGLRERNAQITQNYNKRVEKYYYLQQEAKRLTSKNKTTWEIAEEQEVDITECRKESQLYKDLYTKVNTQNMVYKRALEFYADQSNYRYTDISMPEILADEGEIANKALWSDHQ